MGDVLEQHKEHNWKKVPVTPAPDNPHKAAGDMLLKAKDLVAGDRYQVYGRMEENFSHIAKLWTIHLQNVGILPGNRALTPPDAATLLELLKIARRGSPGGAVHDDNYIDAAGYAAIAGQLAKTSLDKLSKE